MDKTKDEIMAMIELILAMQEQRLEFKRKYSDPKAERIIVIEFEGLILECRLKEAKK